jgi:hypothetical protein
MRRRFDADGPDISANDGRAANAAADSAANSATDAVAGDGGVLRDPDRR